MAYSETNFYFYFYFSEWNSIYSIYILVPLFLALSMSNIFFHLELVSFYLWVLLLQYN